MNNVAPIRWGTVTAPYVATLAAEAGLGTKCQAGHTLHEKCCRVIRHSVNGKTYRRCLVCHAIRQATYRQRKRP